MLSQRNRRRAKQLLARAPAPLRDSVSRLLLRGYERYLAARQARAEGELRDHDLPVPPPDLRVVVVGHADAKQFLASGRGENRILREALASAGRPVEQLRDVLDWGCGCGRLSRWWADVEGPRFHGCDYNPKLVEWVDRNLPFVEANANRLKPPLPYGPDSFDFVYALSVLTHITDDLAVAWMEEVRRVLRPGGLFFFTVHGESYRDRLTPAEAERFIAGRSIVQFSSVEGTNLCAAYHPRRFVEGTLADGFELIAVTEAHTLSDVERKGLRQDRYLLRAPSE